MLASNSDFNSAAPLLPNPCPLNNEPTELIILVEVLPKRVLP